MTQTIKETEIARRRARLDRATARVRALSAGQLMASTEDLLKLAGEPLRLQYRAAQAALREIERSAA